MLLSESELNMYNADSILDEAVLLDESESVTKLPSIPVVENSRLGCGMVSINDLCNLVEDYDCSFEDAFCSIAEENEIDTDSLAVVVEDYNLIEMPELVDIVPNIVVKPISEDNIVYQFVDACINEYYETGDEDWLYNILDEAESVLHGKSSKEYENGKIMKRGFGKDKKSNGLGIVKTDASNWTSLRTGLSNGRLRRSIQAKRAKKAGTDVNKTGQYLLKRAKEHGKALEALGGKTEKDFDKQLAKGLANQLRTSQQQVAQLTSKNQQLTADAEHRARQAMGAQDARQALAAKRAEQEKQKQAQAPRDTSTIDALKKRSSAAWDAAKQATADTQAAAKKAKYTGMSDYRGAGGATPNAPSRFSRGVNFAKNHKAAIGLGVAGVAGAALAARKIAALRKQQQQHPGLRGKLQAIINKLKAKLH